MRKIFNKAVSFIVVIPVVLRVSVAPISILSVSTAEAQQIVNDPVNQLTLLEQLKKAQEMYSKAIEQLEQMWTMVKHLKVLADDIKDWENLDWDKFSKTIDDLFTIAHDVNTIAETTNKNISSLGKANSTSSSAKNLRQDFKESSNNFKESSEQLLEVLSTQKKLANRSMKSEENKAKNSRNLKKVSQVAQATLDSVSNLTVITAAEINAANAYRKHEVDKEIDQNKSLNNFIGDKYQMQSKSKTTVGN